MIPRLCYITDGRRGTAGRPLDRVVREAAGAGLEMVIVRERTLPDAKLGDLLESLRPLRERGLRLLVSRRLDLVRAHGLDGVHLAADGVGVSEARAWLGARALLGYSAHSREDAQAAAAAGADYVTLSPIYATASKPGARGRGTDWLAAATHRLGIPTLALGGVTPARTPILLQSGAVGVAAVAAIGAAADIPEAEREFRRQLGENEK